MKWEQVLEKMGQIKHNEGVETDPFQRMAGTEGARVSSTVGRSLEYGEIKCSATVSLDCPQSEAYIDLAGEVAFRKALELANDGMCELAPGVPRIGED